MEFSPTINCDVHLPPLPEGPEPVETALLVDVLKVLYEGHVHVEECVLVPELPVGGTVRPHQEDSAHHAGDEVVGPPPALDAGPVDDEDGLSDGEGAVVPDDQEHEDQVQHSVVQEVVGGGQDAAWDDVVNTISSQGPAYQSD